MAFSQGFSPAPLLSFGKALPVGVASRAEWLGLTLREEIDPAFEHVAKEDLPLVEDGKVSARVIMGTLWGATSPITQHAATIYADILMAAGASLPIEAEADERAVLVLQRARDDL